MPDPAALTTIRKHLFDDSAGRVYSILDGASVPGLPQVLWEREPEHVCLYRGELAPDLAETAPYLVKLERESPFTTWLLTGGWGNHWGIFVMTPADVDLGMLRRHFRKFLMVYGPDGKLIYFRYYDPRVLRVYLPTCNAHELDIVFGPIVSYALEDEDPSFLISFWTDDGELRTEKVPLERP